MLGAIAPPGGALASPVRLWGFGCPGPPPRLIKPPASPVPPAWQGPALVAQRGRAALRTMLPDL
jgi:hypothetical protein